ncbi:Rv3654c family TadE-like protein [Nonomuraea sp. LP-02]|uniref:Rv3654c family TadE-like protein n=1 Tax=Nonomuraea sp. LP-02 TaxID=3097960 RepID=UPI002E365B38|nr:Rv3654c family TadE-like protein [Nonomuraea sp. LP-02]MED7928283.1 Rv3654c family TadE-like protein [Nonomuraea sp. LP-02]
MKGSQVQGVARERPYDGRRPSQPCQRRRAQSTAPRRLWIVTRRDDADAGERGSATLWGVALMGLLMAVATAFATVGTARVARHRVNDAADLSALAAARLALLDPQEACARAGALAADNGVEMTRCEISGEVADVWTALSISLPVVGTGTVRGRARAGPAP